MLLLLLLKTVKYWRGIMKCLLLNRWGGRGGARCVGCCWVSLLGEAWWLQYTSHTASNPTAVKQTDGRDSWDERVERNISVLPTIDVRKSASICRIGRDWKLCRWFVAFLAASNSALASRDDQDLNSSSTTAAFATAAWSAASFSMVLDSKWKYLLPQCLLDGLSFFWWSDF